LLLCKMRTAFAVLALAGLSQAKVFLFNAEKCNTNFDNMDNWNNPNPGSTLMTPVVSNLHSPPRSIHFESAGGAQKAVSVRVNAGDYAVGSMTFQPNMKMMFDVEGVRLGFVASKDADGVAAQFTAGQDTHNPACSLGCHSNFFEFLGRNTEEAADIDLVELNSHTEFDSGFAAVPAGRTPCDTDTIVIPKRYGVNLLSLGFHPYKELVYPFSDEKLVTVEAEEDLPAFMMFPTSNQKVFIGQNVLDDCADHGLLDDADRCICISECPAPEDALQESNRLRDAAKAFAQRELRAYNKDGTMERFDWTFGYAFEPTAINAYPCDLSERAVADTVEKYSGGYLSSAGVRVEIDEETATIRASGRLVGRAGDFDGQTMVAGPIQIMDSYEPLGSGVMAEYEMQDTKDLASMQLAMTVYHAVVDEMQKECKIRGSSDLLDKAGVTFVKGERTVVYAGNNLPQIDVNRMVDENNKAGIVDHVYEQVQSVQGFQDLSKDAMYGSWKLATPEDRTKGRRAARLGLATNLVQVNLEYSRWSTGSGVDKRHIERVVNHLLATYDVTTHHKCFTFDGGFDEECIGALVAGAVQAKLDGCPPESVRSCFDDAKAVALAITIEIKGCGLIGAIPGPAGAEAACADPDEEDKRSAEADVYAAGVAEFETAAAEDRHAAAVAAAIAAAELAAEQLAGRIGDAGAARNASLSERENALNARLQVAKSDALEIAASNDNLDEPVDEAKAASAVREGEVDAKEAALASCNEAEEAARETAFPGDADCSGAEGALFNAQDALKTAKETEYTLRKLQLQLLKQVSEGEGLDYFQNKKLDEIVEEIEEELQDVRRAIGVAEQERDTAKGLFDKNLCVTMHDEIEGCDTLGLTLATARAKVAALKAEEVDTEAALDDATAAQGNAKSAIEPTFFDEMLNVVLVAAGVIILLIVVVGAVLISGGGGGGGGGSQGQQGNWENDRSVVAFENPMYDDPNAGAARAPSMKRSPSKKKAAAAAAMADDGGGLYDEPAFNDETPAGGGYLDVEPDDDDDESEEESEEESSEEEESDDDDE